MSRFGPATARVKSELGIMIDSATERVYTIRDYAAGRTYARDSDRHRF